MTAMELHRKNLGPDREGLASLARLAKLNADAALKQTQAGAPSVLYIMATSMYVSQMIGFLEGEADGAA